MSGIFFSQLPNFLGCESFGDSTDLHGFMIEECVLDVVHVAQIVPSGVSVFSDVARLRECALGASVLLELIKNESPAVMWERVEAGNIEVFRAQSGDGRSIATFYYAVRVSAKTRSFTCIGRVRILDSAPHLSSSSPR